MVEPASTSVFDPVRAARVAVPAVAMVIVRTPGGVVEGSGFAFQSDGQRSFLLTNNHVVSGAANVLVLMPDGRHFSAEVVGADANEDLAVLRVPASLPVVKFADSTKLQVGQPVLAIGSPLGNQSSVTAGVISALHRTLSSVGRGLEQESLPDVLQTDAPINPGNSGGPLVDGNGNVVGVNTAGAASANGIGFAIPSAIAQRVAMGLLQGRQANDPFLGVCTLPIEEALAQGIQVSGFGDLVRGVVSGGPASQAGIKAGDMIEGVDGVTLNNGQTLGGVLQLHNPGDQVTLTVERNGSTTTLKATLAARPARPPSCQG